MSSKKLGKGGLKRMIHVQRNEVIDLLERYSLFLEKHGYTDNDWRVEPPFAIDEFLKEVKNGSDSK